MKSRHFHWCYLLLLVLLAPSGAQAAFKTGNDLVKHMKAWEKAELQDPDVSSADGSQLTALEEGVYIGFVVGIFDGHDAEFCADENVTVRQVVAIVAKYLNEHPEAWNQPAHRLVLRALQSAFPCK